LHWQKWQFFLIPKLSEKEKGFLIGLQLQGVGCVCLDITGQQPQIVDMLKDVAKAVCCKGI